MFIKKNKKERPVKASKKEKRVQVEKHIDIPLASDEVKSYFDDSDDINLGEFVLVEDAKIEEKAPELSETSKTEDIDFKHKH